MEQRPTLDEVRSPLKEQRPTLDEVRSPLKEKRTTLLHGRKEDAVNLRRMYIPLK